MKGKLHTLAPDQDPETQPETQPQTQPKTKEGSLEVKRRKKKITHSVCHFRIRKPKGSEQN